MKNLFTALDSNQVFQYLHDTLTDSITMWDYFVNWGKVLGNIRDIEIDLNTLNYLVGKQNIEEEFKILLAKQPNLVRLIPILLATREKNFKILVDTSSGKFHYQDYSFEESLFLQKPILIICVNLQTKPAYLIYSVTKISKVFLILF